MMTTRRGAPFLPMSIVLTVAACVRPCTYPLIQRSGETAEQAALVQQMRVAECIDRMTSASWTKNPTLHSYYSEKAHDVHDLIVRLEGGETPSQKEINQALDTSRALQWSGFSY
jgi:hypothetical protein